MGPSKKYVDRLVLIMLFKLFTTWLASAFIIIIWYETNLVHFCLTCDIQTGSTPLKTCYLIHYAKGHSPNIRIWPRRIQLRKMAHKVPISLVYVSGVLISDGRLLLDHWLPIMDQFALITRQSGGSCGRLMNTDGVDGGEIRGHRPPQLSQR